MNVLGLAAARTASGSSLDPTVAQAARADPLGACARPALVTPERRPEHDELRVAEPRQSRSRSSRSCKVDYNLTTKHRLSGDLQLAGRRPRSRPPERRRRAVSRARPTTASYVSYRPLASGSLRSTLSSSMVNEMRGGGRWGPGLLRRRRQQRPADVRGHGTATRSALGNIGNTLTNWHTQNDAELAQRLAAGTSTTR